MHSPFLVDRARGLIVAHEDLEGATRPYCEQLKAAGLRRGDRLAILMPSSLEFALLYFACLRSGITVVPLNPELPPREMRYVLSVARAKRIASATPGDDRLPIPPFEKPAPSKGPFPADFPPDQVFSITFTSGTTARPKGVVHTVGSLFGAARAFNERLEFGAGDRFVHVMPMFYMAGFLNTLLCPYVAGATVLLEAPFSPLGALKFWDTVIQGRGNVLWLSPTMMATILRVDRNPRSAEYAARSVKRVCAGTAPLPLSLQREFETKYGVPVLESYGLSETLFLCANGPRDRREKSCGPALPGVGIEVRDGELVVKTPYLMVGYLDPETGEANREGAGGFHTGDGGHVDEEGFVYITGRKKDLIIKGGLNISPRAVEEALAEHPEIAQVAAVGVPHPLYGEEVGVVLVLKTGAAVTPAALAEFCKPHLAPPAVPTRFYVIDSMPSTVTGKIQKNALRERLPQLTELTGANTGGKAP